MDLNYCLNFESDRRFADIIMRKRIEFWDGM